MTFGLRHLLSAALLHALLIALLAGGVQCSRPPVKPPVITAVIYNPEKPPAAAPKRDRAAEQEQLKQKVEEQKQKREAEQKRAEDQQRKQAEEKARLVEEKKRKDADARKLAEQQKAAADKKAAAEAKKKEEQDEKRERDAAAKRELQRQIEMEEALQREGLERDAQREQDANAASAREAALNAWIVALREDIERNWTKPLSAPDQFACALRVQLLPDGSVTSAKIARSCGNAALDKSVEDAVYRASPLPKPADPAVFQRELIINYEP